MHSIRNMNFCYLSAILLFCLSASNSVTKAGYVTKDLRRGIGGSINVGGSATGSLEGLTSGIGSAVGGIASAVGSTANGVGGAAGSIAGDVDGTAKNILGVLTQLGFTDLISLIKEVGLESVFNGDVAVTLIAVPNAVLRGIINLVKADIAFKLALVKTLIIVGKYTVEELADIATNVTQGLGSTLLTLAGSALTIHSYVDGLVLQGGSIIQENLEAGKSIVHVVNNILVPSSQTIEDFLKTSAGVLGQLYKLVYICPAIKSLLSDATKSLTLIVPTVDFIHSLSVDLLTGNVEKILSRLSTIIFPSLFCWEDLLKLVGQSIVDIGGNLQLVSLINATTIQLGANIIVQYSFGIALKNGNVLSVN